MIKAETTHDEARVDERPQATVLERVERSRERPRDQTSRRKMLVRAAAGLAAAGALLEARGGTAQAATGSPFILGVPNDASTTTELGPSPGFTTPDPALQIDAGGNATAVKGNSSSGAGVDGVSTSGSGVIGQSSGSGIAVGGVNSGAGPGVQGSSSGGGNGVVGISATGAASVLGSNLHGGVGV